MASDTAIGSNAAVEAAPASNATAVRDTATRPKTARKRWRRRRFSLLTRRILAVNLIALVIPVGGLLYLGEYRRTLIEAQLNGVEERANLMASAVASGAVALVGTANVERLMPRSADQTLQLLIPTITERVRLFDVDGALMVDSRNFEQRADDVEVAPLPATGLPGWTQQLLDAYDALIDQVSPQDSLETYVERPGQSAVDFAEALSALNGEPASSVRITSSKTLLLSVAVPVSRYRQVAGALMLTVDDQAIEDGIETVRINVLRFSALGLLVTTLLSLYLAWTIAHPIRRLASAADRIRRNALLSSRSGMTDGLPAPNEMLPNLASRRDEIGDLSIALHAMTDALWQRMDAIERFAADVTHEIKNPLSSLRSAVETLRRVDDKERQEQLLSVIVDDVRRLDRLISDISDASRLDSELSRAASEPVDLLAMLLALADIYGASDDAGPPVIVMANGVPVDPRALDDQAATPLTPAPMVLGVADRLVQVLRNLIANARSFSPANGTIRLCLTVAAQEKPGRATIAVEDDGPGMPEHVLDRVFDRFYSERPEGEKFGTHSGLGLSISKQIIEAHGGTISAENITEPDGHVGGARFVISLPLSAT